MTVGSLLTMNRLVRGRSMTSRKRFAGVLATTGESAPAAFSLAIASLFALY